VDDVRFAQISTVVTTSTAFGDAVDLLARHDWNDSTARKVLVLGERKTSRISVALLASSDQPQPSLTSALERVAPSLDAVASSPVLAHQTFDVPFVEIPDWHRATAVRLTRLSIRPARVDVLVGIGREAVIRLRTTTPGFLGAIGLTNAAMGKAIFIELFTSRAALRESEVTAYFDARAAREAGVLTEPPDHEVYQLYPLASRH